MAKRRLIKAILVSLLISGFMLSLTGCKIAPLEPLEKRRLEQEAGELGWELGRAGEEAKDVFDILCPGAVILPLLVLVAACILMRG